MTRCGATLFAMRSRVTLHAAAAALAMLLLSSGCGTTDSPGSMRYLAQSVSGHLDLLRRARPVPEWLADAATPQLLRERLLLTQKIRDFASLTLKLPDNRSYRAFADLERPSVVWNVVAAPELSLTLETWCFPVMGCVGYRGYFDKVQAEALGEQLRAKGLEVNVYGVPAYSTLGWTNWLGGDPLLNTFIRWPEGQLARLIFHELAHQVAYAADDTMFNESFATAVERLGEQRWRAAAGRANEDDVALRRHLEFRALSLRARAELNAVYRSNLTLDAKRQSKASRMAALRAEYESTKAKQWNGFAGYDAWMAGANNASLAILAAYDGLVPEFERLFKSQGGDFERFYAEVKRLAALPKDERRATLQAAP